MNKRGRGSSKDIEYWVRVVKFQKKELVVTDDKQESAIRAYGWW